MAVELPANWAFTGIFRFLFPWTPGPECNSDVLRQGAPVLRPSRRGVPTPPDFMSSRVYLRRRAKAAEPVQGGTPDQSLRCLGGAKQNQIIQQDLECTRRNSRGVCLKQQGTM